MGEHRPEGEGEGEKHIEQAFPAHVGELTELDYRTFECLVEDEVKEYKREKGTTRELSA
jgi:hypothetical protein